MRSRVVRVPSYRGEGVPTLETTYATDTYERETGHAAPACVCVCVRAAERTSYLQGLLRPHDGDITVNHGYKQQMTPVDVFAHARWPLSVIAIILLINRAQRFSFR